MKNILIFAAVSGIACAIGIYLVGLTSGHSSNEEGGPFVSYPD